MVFKFNVDVYVLDMYARISKLIQPSHAATVDISSNA